MAASRPEKNDDRPGAEAHARPTSRPCLPESPPMPTVLRCPEPAPAPLPAAPHDWLLPHVADLLRCCAKHGLAAEEAAFAEAIESLAAARRSSA